LDAACWFSKRQPDRGDKGPADSTVVNDPGSDRSGKSLGTVIIRDHQLETSAAMQSMITATDCR
jgi:hypothetical protein